MKFKTLILFIILLFITTYSYGAHFYSGVAFINTPSDKDVVSWSSNGNKFKFLDEATFKSNFNLEAGTDFYATSTIDSALALKANLNAPTFTGNYVRVSDNYPYLQFYDTDTSTIPALLAGWATDVNDGRLLLNVAEDSVSPATITYVELDGQNERVEMKRDLYLDTNVGFEDSSGTLWKDSFTFAFLNPTSDDDFLVKAVDPFTSVTITDIDIVCLSGDGSNYMVGAFDICDDDGTNCSAVDSDITANGGKDSDDGSLSDPTATAGEQYKWHTTSVTGSPGYCTISVKYTYVP